MLENGVLTRRVVAMKIFLSRPKDLSILYTTSKRNKQQQVV